LLQHAGASWTTATTVVGADQALDLAFLTAATPVYMRFAIWHCARVERLDSRVIGRILRNAARAQ
jgi:hypothetical protein